MAKISGSAGFEANLDTATEPAATEPTFPGEATSKELLPNVIAEAFTSPIPIISVPGFETDIQLTDVTKSTGIDFKHTDGSTGKGYIVEGMSCGLITFDYDQDGLIDIYFLNGSHLGPDSLAVGNGSGNRLYKNLGDWKFTDVTEAAGVGDTGFALGGTAGDYDGDGDLDLYVCNFGPNVLYRNEGNGKFTNTTEIAGVAGGLTTSAGCSFFDKDNDGDLDLYVANYVNFSFDNYVPIVMKDVNFQAGPQYYEPVPDTLYENNGNGTFTDVSGPSGIASVSGPGMATLCWDVEGDGDQDVFVCNDGQPNFLFINDGIGNFRERAVVAGVAYDFSGKANSSMGVDLGDYNGDGQPDLFVTDYQGELPVLYRNLGDGFFEDYSTSAKIEDGLFAHVHWGTAFADFDNDGDQDLYIACGHFDPIELIDDRTAKNVRNYVLMNLGVGTFADVTSSAGDGMKIVASSRGVATDDLDNDGDIDVVVLNSAAIPTILRNDTQSNAHWIQVDLEGDRKNRFAVGSVVRLHSTTRSQMAVAVSGRGYQGHFGTRIHFGIGDPSKLTQFEVVWSDGTTENFQIPGIDRIVRLVKGKGVGR